MANRQKDTFKTQENMATCRSDYIAPPAPCKRFASDVPASGAFSLPSLTVFSPIP